MMKMRYSGMMALALVAAGAVAGCSQDADGRAWWEPRQTTVTPTDTGQAQDTLGGHDAAPNYVWQTGAPPACFEPPLNLENPYPDSAGVQIVSGDKSVSGLPVHYVQQVTINYTQTSDTAADQAQTAGTTVTPGQQGDQAPTVNADQRVDPTVSTQAAFGMPGSAPTATGAAAGQGGQVDLTATTENQLTTTLQTIAAQQQRIAALLELLAPTPAPEPSPTPALE